MPALLSVPGTARGVVNMTHAGRAMANVFHFTRADLGNQVLSQADVDDIATRLSATWRSGFLINQTSDVALVNVEVTDISAQDGFQATDNTTGTGGNSVPSLPANCAVCISWEQPFRYRGGHPRTYIGGIHRDTLADNRHFSTGFANQTAGHAEVLREEFETDWPLCLVRRTLNNGTLNPPRRHIITGQHVNTRIDSQRRRLGRV